MSGGTLQVKKVELAWPKKVIADLRVLALSGYPNEVCGVIHEHAVIRQLPNTFCGDKAHGFDFEVDITDPSIRAVWHSHPNGPNQLSADDCECMHVMLEHGLRFPWIIVTPTCVTEWMGLIY